MALDNRLKGHKYDIETVLLKAHKDTSSLYSNNIVSGWRTTRRKSGHLKHELKSTQRMLAEFGTSFVQSELRILLKQVIKFR